MRQVLLAAMLAAGLSGAMVAGAKADKTWNSDPSVPGYSATGSYSGGLHCNADGTQCWQGQ